MMKYLFLFLFIGLWACSNSPVPAEPQPSVVPVRSEPLTTCFFKESNYTRATKEPFSTADKVEVVSYHNRKEAWNNNELIRDNVFIVDSLLEVVTLNQTQCDTLFSLLYNYGRNEKYALDENYYPHHSIVFYKKEIPFAFLELCFVSNNYKNTKGLYFGEFCDEKMCMLQRFFRRIGLKSWLSPYICP